MSELPDHDLSGSPGPRNAAPRPAVPLERVRECAVVALGTAHDIGVALRSLPIESHVKALSAGGSLVGAAYASARAADSVRRGDLRTAIGLAGSVATLAVTASRQLGDYIQEVRAAMPQASHGPVADGGASLAQ